MNDRRIKSDSFDQAVAPRRLVWAWSFTLLLHFGLGLAGYGLLAKNVAPTPAAILVRDVGIVVSDIARPEQYFAEAGEPSDLTDDELYSANAASGDRADLFPASSDVEAPRLLPSNSPEVAEGAGILLPPTISIASGIHDGEFAAGLPLRNLPAIDEAAVMADELRRNPKKAAPIGTVAELSLFGTSAAGRSFVLVIDRSQSMGGEGLGAIHAATRELESQLQSLTADQRVQVVAYNDAAIAYSDAKLVPATAGEQVKLIRFVGGIVASGGTEHRAGILAALRFKPEVIFLLTDGGDPPLTTRDLRLITTAADGETQIHCLQFGQGKRDESDSRYATLVQLARATGGEYRYVDLLTRDDD